MTPAEQARRNLCYYSRRQRAMATECQFCKAPSGAMCQTKSGRYSKFIHWARAKPFAHPGGNYQLRVP